MKLEEYKQMMITLFLETIEEFSVEKLEEVAYNALCEAREHEFQERTGRCYFCGRTLNECTCANV